MMRAEGAIAVKICLQMIPSNSRVSRKIVPAEIELNPPNRTSRWRRES